MQNPNSSNSKWQTDRVINKIIDMEKPSSHISTTSPLNPNQIQSICEPLKPQVPLNNLSAPKKGRV